MSALTEREKVVEVLNRLYFYTDHKDWERLQSEVFAPKVLLDMTSLGATKAEKVSAQSICEQWSEGFRDLDAVHHQAGTYVIDLLPDGANAKAYAIASHYKSSAKNGTLREFIGSYDIHLIIMNDTYRIDSLRFNLKYMAGNTELS